MSLNNTLNTVNSSAVDGDFLIKNREDEIHLRQYLYVIWRRRWIFITTFICVLISITVYTFYQKPLYQAVSTVIIDPDLPQMSDINGAPTVNFSNDFYQTQYEIMRSYAVLKKTFEMLNMEKEPEYEEVKNPIEKFQKCISVEPIRNTRLARLIVKGPDPDKVAEQANTLARVYIQHNLEDRRNTSRDAFEWLAEQIVVLKAKVEKSEIDLLKFKSEEDIVSLEKRQSLLEERLSITNENYNKINAHRLELETMLDEMEKLKNNIEMADSLPKISENSLIQTLKEEYVKLTINLAQLTVKYKPKHPQILRLQSQIDNIKERIADEMSKITKGIEIEYRLAKSNEEAIKNNLEEVKRESMVLAQKSIQYGVLKRDTESNQQLYEVLLHRMKETDVSGSITVNNIRIVDEAKAPLFPFKPNKKLNLLLGAITGLLMATGLSFFLEYMDDNIKGEDDVAIYLKEHCLGLVPKEKIKDVLEMDGSGVLERAYRDLKTTLIFYKSDHILKTLLITSANPSEGKTTSVILLAKAFAKEGHRVLVMDLDLFKPDMGKLLHVDNKQGIVDCFLSDIPLQDIIQETTIPNLSIISGGLIPPNPAELVGSKRLKEMIEAIKSDYDIIILDSPPFSIGLEIALLGSFVDGIIVVVKANHTSRTVVTRAINGLKAGKGNVLGLLTTATEIDHGDAGKYYYKYYHKSYEPVAK